MRHYHISLRPDRYGLAEVRAIVETGTGKDHPVYLGMGSMALT